MIECNPITVLLDRLEISLLLMNRRMNRFFFDDSAEGPPLITTFPAVTYQYNGEDTYSERSDGGNTY